MARLAGKTGSVYVATQLIEDCEDAWTTAGAGRVCSADTTYYRVGSGSAKVVTTTIGVTTLLEYEDLGASIDLVTFTKILAWVRSSVNQAAGDCQLLLDDTAGCGTPLESLDLPALTADTWKLASLTLAAPAGLSAVASVGIKQITDLADMSFWVDEVRAAKAITGIKSWALDQTVDVLETTAFDSAGVRAYIAAGSGWSGSFEGFKDGAPLTIGSVYHLELQESTTSTQKYVGSAVLTGLHPKTDIAGLVTYSYDFQGTHDLTIATT